MRLHVGCRGFVLALFQLGLIQVQTINHNSKSISATTNSDNNQTETEQIKPTFEFISTITNIDDKSNEFLPNMVETRQIEMAADYGLRMMNELIAVKEPELYHMGLQLDRNDPASKVASFNAPSPQAVQLGRYGYATLLASTKLLQQMLKSESLLVSRKTPVTLPVQLRETLLKTTLHAECPLRGAVLCRPAARRYRTSDGTCNNLEHPKRGAALIAQQRFLPPRYDDGLQTVRRSVVNRSPLPSARLLSTRIHRDRNIETPTVTLMLMQWGQFIDHDITSTPQSRAFNGSTPRCCADGGRGFLSSNLMHPECLPIPVPNDDWFFSRLNIKCMEFVRSAPAPREDCDFGHRQQLNQVTSYIDASTIYGSSASQTDSMRSFRNGALQYFRLDNRNPPDPPMGDLCRNGAITPQCFRMGDLRAPEQPALTAMHIMWLRKHNQLAETLTKLNPQWSDEKTFQETRRLIGALIQHITYREYLPIILGHEVMKLFGLTLETKGYYNQYDSNVNPSPSNSFTASAYRFGHSLVQNSFMRSDRFHQPIFNNVTLHNEQSNVENIWSLGSIDRIMLGMCNQPSQKRDEFIAEELTNHLFQPPGFPFGMDLAAINIQRGRDHGLPPYTAWRIPCGLSAINNWNDLERVMSSETVTRFRSLYLDVNDIDLYSAGLAERPVRGGLVGPTFACIIAQQFLNLRKGDRFWYENGGFESSFTPAQLQQIRKLNLAQIVCETMPEVETIQPFVLLSSDHFRNQRQLCENLVNFDMEPWIETRDKPGLNVIDENGLTTRTNHFDHLNRTKRDSNTVNAQTDTVRTDRKRKRPNNRRPTKPKPRPTPNRTKNVTSPVTTILETKPKRNKTRTELKQLYLGLNKITVNRLPETSTSRPRPTLYQNLNNYLDEMHFTLPTKLNQNSLTYLVNTVRSTTSTTSTTTPKPEYQFHIQINYFFNGTTERYYDERPEPFNQYHLDYNKRYSTKDHTITNSNPIVIKPRPLNSDETFEHIKPNGYGIYNFITDITNQIPQPNPRPNPRPTYDYYNRRPTIDRKSDSSPQDKKYVMVVTTGKDTKPEQDTNSNSNTDTNVDTDKRYVRISTIKGHMTSTDSLNPVFVSVQKKESEDDLEMTYDDIFEVYAKPEKNFTTNLIQNQIKEWKIYNTTTESETNPVPIPKPNNNDLFSTELPKPMKLFMDDGDTFGL